MECTLVFVPSDFLQVLCQLMRLDTDSLETIRDIFSSASVSHIWDRKVHLSM
jgi:hypothetical protein